jgi:hypothetical protein
MLVAAPSAALPPGAGNGCRPASAAGAEGALPFPEPELLGQAGEGEVRVAHLPGKGEHE